MDVHRSIDALPLFRNAVITIGTFDGVHLGHQKIIDALLQQALDVDGESIVITFEPHPRKVVHPSISLQLINTLDEKIELLQTKGINHLVIVPFTSAFSELSPEEYVRDFVVKRFLPHTVIIGYDHHFGKNRKGNFHLLEKMASECDYTLLEIPKHVLNEIDISSTKIRNALIHSDIKTANGLLGYPYFFEGMVVDGDKLGRQLGYPTANIEYTSEDKIRLGDGVYAVYAVIDGKLKKGMMSIGNRPTLTDSTSKIEVNIFDFDRDIYGKTIRVIVQKYLRQQKKYDTMDDLKKQIALDKEQALTVL